MAREILIGLARHGMTRVDPFFLDPTYARASVRQP